MEQLGEIRQRGGKRVIAFALERDLDVRTIRSNTFKIEWPPRSGKWITIPEVDRAEFFDIATARQKINPAQADFLDELTALLKP